MSDDRKIQKTCSSLHVPVNSIGSGPLPLLCNNGISGNRTGSRKSSTGFNTGYSGYNDSRLNGKQNGDEISPVDFAYWLVCLSG